MQNKKAIFYEFSLFSLTSETFFETNSSTLSKEGENMLSTICEIVSHRSDLPIVISGHTDNTGDETKNLELSQNRAKAVANFLINKGLNENNIKSTTGFGSSKPISTNSTNEGKSKNRRVEIKQVKN
jgi:outer membrane protein OmpA-like peptidoglycan-associated protein